MFSIISPLFKLRRTNVTSFLILRFKPITHNHSVPFQNQGLQLDRSVLVHFFQLFRSCFFPSRSVPFLGKERSSHSVPFLFFQSKNGFIPPFHSQSIRYQGGGDGGRLKGLGLLQRCPRQKCCRKEVVKKFKNGDFIIKCSSRRKYTLNCLF